MYTPSEVMDALLGAPVDIDMGVDLTQAACHMSPDDLAALAAISRGDSIPETFGGSHPQDTFRELVKRLTYRMNGRVVGHEIDSTERGSLRRKDYARPRISKARLHGNKLWVQPEENGR